MCEMGALPIMRAATDPNREQYFRPSGVQPKISLILEWVGVKEH